MYKIVPKGLRERIALGRDVIRSTTDCERQWKNFRNSHRNLRRVSHRLNLYLSKKPPQLDDVNAIEGLKRKVEIHFCATSMPNFHPRRKCLTH